MRELGQIEQQIRDDAIAALKAGDKQRREALSSFVAALKKERIDSRKEPTEADELTVLKRERKRRAEAIELYDQAGRKDLADRERFEEELLASYMPEELSHDALEELVDEGIAATSHSQLRWNKLDCIIAFCGTEGTVGFHCMDSDLLEPYEP